MRTNKKYIPKIKEAAKKFKGWSVYRLAQYMKTRNQKTVYSWANGDTQASYEDLQELASIIGCTASDLLGF